MFNKNWWFLNFQKEFLNFSFCIRKLAVAFYMINEIQPKIKFQNIVQCPFNKIDYQASCMAWQKISGGIKGGHGGIPPSSWTLCPPLSPQSEEKMAKISHFWQIFGYLSPQIRILPPRSPQNFWCCHWQKSVQVWYIFILSEN